MAPVCLSQKAAPQLDKHWSDDDLSSGLPYISSSAYHVSMKDLLLMCTSGSYGVLSFIVTGKHPDLEGAMLTSRRK